MKVFKYILLTSLMITFTSCEKLMPEDDELTLTQQDYNGDELRTDGYYYLKSNPDHFMGGYFFYKNGIHSFVGGRFLLDNMEELENNLRNNYYDLNHIYIYGLFQINDTNIKFERLYPGEIKTAYIREGTILNDTTFHITESYRMKDNKKTEVRVKDEIYHFKQFSPKPDSTNSFIP